MHGALNTEYSIYNLLFIAIFRSVMASVYGKAALKARDYTLVLEPPDWNSPSIVEQAARKTPPIMIKKLCDLQDVSLELEKPSVDFEFKIAPNPFAEDSECYIYYATDLINFQKIILKLLKNSEGLDFYMKKLENRVLCTAYAREFSMEKSKPRDTCSIDFVQLDIIECAGDTFYMLEPYMKPKLQERKDEKASYSDLLQAFSHYTWITSRKTLLICSPQGFKKKLQNKIFLTDPTIHSSGEGGKYGNTDCGMKGVQKFFDTHVCSDICKKMNISV